MERTDVIRCVSFVLIVLSPLATLAQSDAYDSKLQVLHKELDELRERMSRVEGELHELESTKGGQSTTPPSAALRAQEAAIHTSQPSLPRDPSGHIVDASITYRQPSEDAVAAAHVDSVPGAPMYSGIDGALHEPESTSGGFPAIPPTATQSPTPTPTAAQSSQEGTNQTNQPVPPAAPSGHLGKATSTYQTFSEDSHAAPRFDNVPLDPKYTGFFRLPGTQTLLKIGGYFKTDFIYDLKPAGNPDEFVPSSIPIPTVVGVNNANISIRPTRLSFDFRVPTTRLGEVRLYLEGDLFGTNATTPRMRHAYTQVANFLLGQTFTNFMDPDGFPDTLDFEGPNGLVNLRNPQLRYGFALSKSATLYLSVEKPSSDVAFKTPAGSAEPNAPTPDGTIRLRDEFERGHFQVSGLFRSISAFLPDGRTDSVFGWGVNASAGVNTFGKDNVILAVGAGHGISRYIQDTSGLGIDAEPADAASPHLEATPAVGVEGGYQHYWMKKLRSSGVYSYAGVSNTDLAASSTYNHSTYTAGNLIWNPYGSLNLGGEFLYGWTMLQNGQKADAPRFQFSAKYSFVKMNPE